MKIRVFQDMNDSVLRAVVFTEDWSQRDIELMLQYGEPEVNVGGEIHGDGSDINLGDAYVRLLHGFPYSMGFDIRDYGSYENASAACRTWKDEIVSRVRSAVLALRANDSEFPSEEVVNV